jgi:YHS domain-containing protein
MRPEAGRGPMSEWAVALRSMLPFLASSFLLAGCATAPEPAASETESGAAASQEAGKPEAQAASWPGDLPIHQNDDGEVLCPVMGSVVASPEAAVGFQDYEGKRYYFCCGGCPESFKKDPAKYAKK